MTDRDWHYVSTRKKRFAHKRMNGAQNSKCGALPEYYHGQSLDIIPDAEAQRMHQCRKCFPLS